MAERAVVLALAVMTVSSALTAVIIGGMHDSTDRKAGTEAAYDPTTFTVVTIGEPDYLDPAVDYETAGGEVIQNVYETLIWYQRESVITLVPVLATAVPTLTNGGISPDGKNYTFNLRSGVMFHNGEVMTSDDVEYSLERVLRIHDPDGPSWMMEQIMNDYIQYYVGGPLSDYKNDSYNAPWALAVIGGTSNSYVITEQDVQNVSQASVEKLNATAVRVRLTHSYPAFLSIAAYTVMSIVSKAFVEDHGGVVNSEHNDYMDENTCGTGPYKLANWDKGFAINLTRFDDYWGPNPSLKDIHILKANDVTTRIQMLQDGDADTGYVPISNESEFLGDPDFEITKGLPTFNMDFVGFNMEINTTQAATFGSTVPMDFFTDKEVRKAFTNLLDAQLFIANYAKGNGIQPNGIIPAGMFGYNATAPVYEYNVTKAKEHLENATNPGTGNSWWEDGFTVAFIYNAGNLVRETACQYLKQALESMNSFPGTHGVFQATINALDWPTYLTNTRMSPSPLPIFFLGWAPDYADPDDYVNPFLYSRGTYPTRTGYSNATIDSLVLSAASELDTATRSNLYHQITNLCYDDAPYIWLIQSCNFHVERSWVQGWYFNAMYCGEYFAALSKEVFGNAPNFIVPPSSPVVLDNGEEFEFNIMVADIDEDDINITWEWGDGSPDSTNLSTAGSAGEWISQIHAWTAPAIPGVGDYFVTYNMTVVLDDGEGFNASRVCTVMVYVGPNLPPTLCVSLSRTMVGPGEDFTIITNATDPEGDPLTWTYTINNGTASWIADVRTTASTAPSTLVWSNLSANLSEVDDYWITVDVSDALPPYQVSPHNMSISVSLMVVENTPPFSTNIWISPAAPVIDVAVGEVSVDFSIEVLDLDGDSITATWQLGEDVGPVANASSGGLTIFTFNQTRVFTGTGYYNVSVVVTDGRLGHEVTKSTVLTVTSNNMPPQFEGVIIEYSQIVSSLPNETINITLVFTDPEEDIINGTIDFGDGSPLLQFTADVYVGGSARIVVNHSYELVGTYDMTINYSDGVTLGLLNHTKTGGAQVVVSDVLIPEFSVVLLPVLSILVVSMLSRLRRARR